MAAWARATRRETLAGSREVSVGDQGTGVTGRGGGASGWDAVGGASLRRRPRRWTTVQSPAAAGVVVDAVEAAMVCSGLGIGMLCVEEEGGDRLIGELRRKGLDGGLRERNL